MRQQLLGEEVLTRLCEKEGWHSYAFEEVALNGTTYYRGRIKFPCHGPMWWSIREEDVINLKIGVIIEQMKQAFKMEEL